MDNVHSTSFVSNALDVNLLSTPQHNVNMLTFLYTNVDSLLNKRTELAAIIAEENPDVIALTEIYAKKH
jgi:hypothetical protein